MTLRAPTAHLPSSRYLRAFIAARSRYAQDHLARAVVAGTRQYVILSAGLDTFAHRTTCRSISSGRSCAELERAGFKLDAPAFISWLGCTPYLARDTVMATFSLIHALCPDNGVVFDYARPRHTLSGVEKLALDAIDASVGLAGEPFVTFFNTEELAAELRTIGFRHVEHPTTDEINARYFNGRLDRLRVRGRVGGLMCAY